MSEKRKPMLIIITGPSGTGKGTVIKRLKEDDDSLWFSVSMATRGPRDGEIDGVHYHFVSRESFEDMVAKDGFLEYAKVHDNYYGTPLKPIEDCLSAGKNAVLDIDVQGGLNIIGQGVECVSIFILPPSMKVLRQRLEERKTETPEQVETRLHNAVWEITQRGKYQYQVVNDDLETCVKQVQAIIEAARHSAAYCDISVPEE